MPEMFLFESMREANEKTSDLLLRKGGGVMLGISKDGQYIEVEHFTEKEMRKEPV